MSGLENSDREYFEGRDSFAFSDYIVSCLTTTFEALQRERYLAGTDLPTFANRLAYYFGEINAIHPFREGNGRTQGEFIRQLAARNGYELAWTRISQDQVIEASRQSLRVGNAGLERLLKLALISPPEPSAAHPSS